RPPRASKSFGPGSELIEGGGRPYTVLRTTQLFECSSEKDMTDDLARGFQRTTSGARLPPTRVGESPGPSLAAARTLPAEEAVSGGKGLNISPLRGAEMLPTKDRTRPLGAPHPSLSCLAGLLGENTLIMPGLDPGIHSVSAR